MIAEGRASSPPAAGILPGATRAAVSTRDRSCVAAGLEAAAGAGWKPGPPIARRR